MAEEAEVIEQTNEQAAASFAAGFDDDAAPQPVAAPAPVAPEPAAAPAPAAPAVEYVQITKEDYDRFMTTVEETARVRRGLDSLAGTVGNHHKAIDQFKNRPEPTAGVAVEITDDDLLEMKEDYPDLATSTLAGLRRIFAKMQSTGTGAPATTVQHDPEAARVEAARLIHQEGLRNLDDMHPGWRQIVGQPGEDNAYRKWLGTQTPEYQELVKTTYSADITARSLDRFKAATAAPRTRTPAPADSRRAALQAAVQPRGTGTPPAPRQPTAEDNFNAGFNS